MNIPIFVATVLVPGRTVLGRAQEAEAQRPHPEKDHMPNFPDVPSVPDLPDVPSVPDLPDIPSVPDLPDLPDIPDDEPAPAPTTEAEAYARGREDERQAVADWLQSLGHHQAAAAILRGEHTL